jgi:hypothetical protein
MDYAKLLCTIYNHLNIKAQPESDPSILAVSVLVPAPPRPSYCHQRCFLLATLSRPIGRRLVLCHDIFKNICYFLLRHGAPIHPASYVEALTIIL